jgi:DNA mismatch repair protein MutL
VNNKIIFDLRPESIDHRLKNVFGKSVYDGLIRFQEEREGMYLEGYIARPDLARNSRGMEFFFLNHRPIENRSLHHAIIQAYGNTIERRQYPPYVMYLKVLPEDVDVNVHPTKMEVKFRKEHLVYQLFYHGVKNALNREHVIPVFSGQNRSTNDHFLSQSASTTIPGEKKASRFSYSHQGRLDLQHGNVEKQEEMFSSHQEFIETIKEMNSSGKEIPLDKETENQHAIPLFQLHNKYILAQSEAGLMIIDQHVAHERILFEKAVDSLKNNTKMPSQQLLFPQTVELTLEDYLIYDEIKDALQVLGFSTNPLSGRTIILESIPTTVKPGYEHKVFLEILDYFKQFEKIKNTNNEVIAAAYACKNAIKSGDKISVEEMEFLLGELFKCKEPFFCPHGRPVIITLPLEELDKKFKRIK